MPKIHVYSTEKTRVNLKENIYNFYNQKVCSGRNLSLFWNAGSIEVLFFHTVWQYFFVLLIGTWSRQKAWAIRVDQNAPYTWFLTSQEGIECTKSSQRLTILKYKNSFGLSVSMNKKEKYYQWKKENGRIFENAKCAIRDLVFPKKVTNLTFSNVPLTHMSQQLKRPFSSSPPNLK